MITLYDVYDTRTDKYHSVVMINPRFAKYFVPASDWEGSEMKHECYKRITE